MSVKIKIRNVYHEESEYNVSDAEEYVTDYIVNSEHSIENVRVAPGSMNSPIFITIDSHTVSFENAKMIAKDALHGFDNFAPLDRELSSMITDKNIKIEKI